MAKKPQPSSPGSPRVISEHVWFYDAVDPKTRRGILVIHEARDKHTGGHIQTDQFVIPWTMLRDALARREAKARKRSKKKVVRK